MSDWDTLFTMRHYGVATRLLDWTSSLGVALYFAVYEAADGATPRIWILNPFKLNKITTENDSIQVPRYLANYVKGVSDDADYGDLLANQTNDGIGWENPIAIQVPQRDVRLFAQRGYFTIHGDDARPIDQQKRGKRELGSCIQYVDIAPETIPLVKKFLKRSGIDQFSMFPDFENLGRVLHEFNGIDDASRRAGVAEPKRAKRKPAPRTRRPTRKPKRRR
jgi:hypothetical protein